MQLALEEKLNDTVEEVLFLTKTMNAPQRIKTSIMLEVF